MYTAHLWWKHTKASIRSIHVAYNNVFRLLFGLDRRCSASEMFALRRVDSCQSILHKAMYSFVVRLKKIPKWYHPQHTRKRLDLSVWSEQISPSFDIYVSAV